VGRASQTLSLGRPLSVFVKGNNTGRSILHHDFCKIKKLQMLKRSVIRLTDKAKIKTHNPNGRPSRRLNIGIDQPSAWKLPREGIKEQQDLQLIGALHRSRPHLKIIG